MPGANPPTATESEEASRPIGDEEGNRRLAASASSGECSPVGICDSEESALPHSGQNRAEEGASIEQLGQRDKLPQILSSSLLDVAASGLRDIARAGTRFDAKGTHSKWVVGRAYQALGDVRTWLAGEAAEATT